METKTMNELILFTSEFPPQPGGIGNHSYNLAVQLAENQFNVQVLTDSRSRDGQQEAEHDNKLGFSVIRVPVRKPRLIMYLNRLFLVFGLVFIKRKENLVLIASGKFPLWGLAFLSLFFRKPRYIAIIHGSEVNFPRGLNRFLTTHSLKRFHKIIGVSNYTLSLVKHFLQKEQLVFIPNGFEPGRLVHNEVGNLRGNPRLITVGGVTRRKGQQNVIKAMPEILKSHPDAHYHIVGIPTAKKEFEALASQKGVLDHITFHGAVSDEMLGKLLGNSHIFCMLSETQSSGDTEGFGIAIIEGNALGLPAIGSAGCGIEDAIKQGCSGILVDSQNSMDVVEAVNTILTDYKRYSENAVAWSEKYTWKEIVKKYVNVIVDELNRDSESKKSTFRR
ncbi:MAG: glycosyltransferase [Acidobacteria bacterium]|nr:MAG: glycosyltransferase [Acidobacteriota bacterium]